MPKQTDFARWVADGLAPLGPIRIRSMFGGFGVYAGENFFAIIVDDVLYLKADETSRERFLDSGSSPFRYSRKDNAVTTLSYYTAPEAALDDPDELLAWARLGIDAARRAKAQDRK